MYRGAVLLPSKAVDVFLPFASRKLVTHRAEQIDHDLDHAGQIR